LDWLESVPEQLTENDTSLLLQALIIAGLSGDIAPERQKTVSGIIEKILSKLRPNLERKIHHCSGTSVLLCCVIEKNIVGEMLPEFEQYAIQAASVLKEIPSTEITEAYQAARILLARLGLLAAPVPVAASFTPDLFTLLTGDEKTVRATANRIAATTYYGKHGVAAPDGLDMVLESITMHTLRRYKLELSGLLLRAIAYLGYRESLGMRTARNYIIANQSMDGPFGFFDEEIEAMRQEVPEPYASLRLQLPVSLACLWALAETTEDNYRLLWDLACTRSSRADFQGDPV
jgi:hypothetical protein